jgi:hypothetical protein
VEEIERGAALEDPGVLQGGMRPEAREDRCEVEDFLDDLLPESRRPGDPTDCSRADHRTASQSRFRTGVGTIRFQSAAIFPPSRRSR